MTSYYQDPRVGEKNKNSTDVLGDEASTASDASNTSSQQSGQSGPIQPQGTQPSASGDAQQPQNMPKKPSSSGMFTNVKQYIEKNKPQGTKMAGAATKNIEKQSQQIQQQAQSKKDALSKQIGSNREQMDKDKSFAQNMITNAGQTPPPATQPVAQAQSTPQGEQPPQPTAPTEQENFDRFRNIASGQTQSGYGNVQDINLSKQELVARRLGQQAEGAKTDAGRKELLRGAFGKDRAYTGGQSSLDNLILGGNADARNQMINQAQAATEGLEPGLKNMRREALENVTSLRRDASSMGSDVTGMADSATQEVKSLAQAEADSRMTSFGSDQMKFREALEGKGELTSDMLNQYISPDQMNKMVSEAQNQQKTLADYLDEEKGGDYRRLSGKNSQYENEGRFAGLAGFDQKSLIATQQKYVDERLAKPVMQEIGGNMSSSEIARIKDQNATSQAQYNRERGLLSKKFGNMMSKKVSGQSIDANTINQRLIDMHKSGKFDASALQGPMAGNISAQNVATAEQNARVQALAKLRGTTSDWIPEQGKQAATEKGKFDMSNFQNLINRGLIKV